MPGDSPRRARSSTRPGTSDLTATFFVLLVATVAFVAPANGGLTAGAPADGGSAGAEIDRTSGAIYPSIDATAPSPAPRSQVEAPDSDAQVELSILAGDGSIDASTYGAGSFVLANTGGAQVESVTIDLSSASMPDMVFDPDGTAGDVVAKGFQVDSNDGAGAIDHELGQPHDGDADDGYDVLEISFEEFDPGDSVEFSIDVDPTSIKGDDAPGPNEAGGVSGLELAGSTLSITDANGTVSSTSLFSDGSAGGAVGVAKASSPSSPSIDVVGVETGSTTLSEDHSAATTSVADQTVEVSGPAGASVRLLRIHAGMFTEGVPGGAYDVEDYEANSALGATVEPSMSQGPIDLGSNGETTVDVTLEESGDDGDLNYLVAVVEDDAGHTGATSNTIVLEYDPTANTPPFADFSYSPASPNVSEAVSFDGSASIDDDGSIDQYTWDVDGDGTEDETGATVSHAYDTAGEHDVTLTVTDDDGATDSVTETVTVEEPVTNNPPSADFTVSPSNPTVGENVTFDGSASTDSDGTIDGYEWDLDGDGTADATGVTAVHSFDTAGDREVAVTVTDDDGATSSVTKTVSVSSPSGGQDGDVVFAVNAGGAAYTATDGTTYAADEAFDGGDTHQTADPIAGTEDDPLYQTERFGGDAPGSTAAPVSYDVPVGNGEYRVTLQFAEIFFENDSQRVFDVTLEGDTVVTGLDLYAQAGHDAAHDVTRTVTVSDGTLDVDFVAETNNAKVSAVRVESITTGQPTAAFTATPSDPAVEESVSFDASSSSDDGTIESYDWDLDGNGTVDESGVTVTHSYGTPGTYDVTLSVTDDDGESDTVTVPVSVSEAKAPPTDDGDDDPSSGSSGGDGGSGDGGGSGGGGSAGPRVSTSKLGANQVAITVEDAARLDTATIRLPSMDGDAGAGTGLTTLRVTPGTATSFDLRVERVDSPQGGTPALEDGVGQAGLAYFTIDHDLTDADLARARLTVRVSKARLDAWGADPDSVTLYRFEDDAWAASDTRSAGEDANYYHYTASFSGLSRFAVGADRTVTPTPTETPSPTPTPTTPTATAAASETASPTAPAVEETARIQPILIGVLILVIIGVGAFSLRYRRR